jgi:hypothetical protein
LSLPNTSLSQASFRKVTPEEKNSSLVLCVIAVRDVNVKVLPATTDLNQQQEQGDGFVYIQYLLCIALIAWHRHNTMVRSLKTRGLFYFVSMHDSVTKEGFHGLIRIVESFTTAPATTRLPSFDVHAIVFVTAFVGIIIISIIIHT